MGLDPVPAVSDLRHLHPPASRQPATMEDSLHSASSRRTRLMNALLDSRNRRKHVLSLDRPFFKSHTSSPFRTHLQQASQQRKARCFEPRQAAQKSQANKFTQTDAMSRPDLRSLELEAGQALAALSGRPSYELPSRHFTLPFASPQQDPQPPREPVGDDKSSHLNSDVLLSTLINEDVERHQDERGLPVFKLLDIHELQCYNHIWHPLESNLHVEPAFKSVALAAAIDEKLCRCKTDMIIFYAETRDWAKMIQHIRQFHDLLLPISSYEWRMPLDTRQAPGAPSSVRPTLENTIWMIVAICQQLFRAAAEGFVDPEVMNQAVVRLQYLTVHLLRRPVRFANPKMMLPAHFFDGTILERSNGHSQHYPGVALPLRSSHAQSEPSCPRSSDISTGPLTDDGSSESPPGNPTRQRLLTPSSPLLFSSFRPANHAHHEADASEHSQKRKRSRSESSIASNQVDDGDASGDTTNGHTTAPNNEPPTQPASEQKSSKRQKGENVLPKTQRELERADKWLDPRYGRPAPKLCVRCRHAHPSVQHKCWIPKDTAKNGATCAYCRSQKTKCSLNPKYANEPDSFFLKSCANCGNAANGTPGEDDNGDEQQFGESSHHAAHGASQMGEPSASGGAQPTSDD